jgi:hypothetical protein
MKHRTIIITVAAGVAAIAIAGTAAAGQFGDDDEQPITGDALARASGAALAHTGEGRVTGTEVGDEDSYYEVEVTLESGKQVDVQLDESFAVVGADADVETGQDD